MENLDLIIEDFWNENVYNCNVDSIYNEHILTIFKEINFLKKKLSSNKIFNITNNFELEISNPKEINKQINKIKKDNLLYIKTHGDCFQDFFLLVGKNYNHLNCLINFDFNKLFSTKSKSYIKNDFNNENKENTKRNSDNLFDILELEKELEIFSKEINLNFKSSNTIDLNSTNKKNLIISKIKKNILSIVDKFNKFKINKNLSEKKILILDTENILKSFKTQDLLKKHVDDFDKLFYTWKYGYFMLLNDFNVYSNNYDCSISLSEYSSSTKYIEPFSSIFLSASQKNELIKKIIEIYLQDYIVIYIINIKNNDEDFDIIINSEINLEKNYFMIPVCFEKNEFREQDDHIIIFLYQYLKNFFDINIISSDKYKWYSGELKIKNFKILYNLDIGVSEILIDDSYTNDLIKYNNIFYKLPFYNYPVISDSYIYNLNKSSKHIFSNVFFKYIEYLVNINKHYIEINNINSEVLINKFITENKLFNDVYDLLNLHIKSIHHNNLKLKLIYNFLNSNSKKDIFKIITEQNMTWKKNFDETYIRDSQELFEKLKMSIHIYFLFKSFTIYYLDSTYSNKLSKIFSLIIYNYDEIEKNITKIRKLANDTTNFNKIFLETNSILIYMKKIGLCKKNF